MPFIDSWAETNWGFILFLVMLTIAVATLAAYYLWFPQEEVERNVEQVQSEVGVFEDSIRGWGIEDKLE